ncbi:hypothetical protein BDW74DRAFT_147608 [Aspergillus multicolor]|uniref:uncharacterized protein n=1 Tax=Aspergillus multicolor TaxID=41759 RepID=UPI003CCD5343
MAKSSPPSRQSSVAPRPLLPHPGRAFAHCPAPSQGSTQAVGKPGMTYIQGYQRRNPTGDMIEVPGHWRGDKKGRGQSETPAPQSRADELAAANARIGHLERKMTINNTKATGVINNMRQKMSSRGQQSQREIEALTHKLWENNSRAEAQIQELRRRNEELESRFRFS